MAQNKLPLKYFLDFYDIKIRILTWIFNISL